MKQMKQSRSMSLIESCINIGVGFGISLGAQILFLPMLGVTINIHQNLAFAAIMTAVSICRSYLLRRLFEALHIRTPLSPFMLAVIAERRRQIEVEGWTPEHDDTEHQIGDLAHHGACYALYPARRDGRPPSMWRWDKMWWKPQDGFRRNLVKACALIVAEGEKTDRNRRHKTVIHPAKFPPPQPSRHPSGRLSGGAEVIVPDRESHHA